MSANDLHSELVTNGVRFSTDQFDDKNRIEAWRASFGHTICQTDIEPIDDTEFRSDVMLRALPGLGVASGSCSGARYWRPKRLIVDDDLIFVVNHAGADLAKMVGREAVVHSGEAVLVTTGAIGGVINKAATRFTTIRIPRIAIESMIPDIHGAMVRPVAANNEALIMLLNYISVLEDGTALATDRMRQHVVGNMHDLIALSLGAAPDATEIAKQNGLSAARLWTFKQDIRRGVLIESISAQTLASRYRVTPRYVQQLFERDGTTLTQFVHMQRLTAAHRILRDPQKTSMKVSDVAAAVGFDDVAYFTRVFRRHFNQSPTEARASSAVS
ncbi:MAG: AraC family transcriptional regulator [Rhizobiales bacterium]|nr:AraC family transcriptional regulator [Hyphomicrobiales bacterium]